MRKRKKMRLECFVLVIVGLALAASPESCKKPNQKARVEVKYAQLAYFDTYVTSEDAFGSKGAGNDGMFILYRIVSIRNQGSEAKAFAFNRLRLLTVQDQLNKDHAAAENELLGSKLVSNVTVAPGEFKTTGLGCIIMRAKVNDVKKTFGGVSGTSAKVDLAYELDDKQPVTITRQAGNDSFTGFGPAHPTELQNKCGP